MAAKKGKRRAYGSGSVYQTKSGAWIAQTRIDGKLVRRRADDEQAAKAKLKEIVELRDGKIDIASGMQAVAAWMDSCLVERIRLRRPKAKTVEEERGFTERYILPVIGDLALLSVRPAHLQKVIDTTYDGIRQEGVYDGARTAIAVATILRRVFALAHARKLIPDNPYSGIALPKYQIRPIEPLDDGVIRAIAAHVADTRLEGLWLCYILLGLRRGEGLGLRWMAYDQAARTLTIDQQLQQIGGEIVFGTPKTAQSVRVLPLTQRLCGILDRQWQAQQAERALWADRQRRNPDLPPWKEYGLIFTAQGGLPIWPTVWGDQFRALRQALRLPASIKPHHMRHTLATLLDECGATEALKAGILGHVKKNETLKYTHARIAAMRVSLQAVEDRLFGAGEGVKVGT